jgi:hypothetical protein
VARRPCSSAGSTGFSELVEIRFRLPGIALKMEGWDLSLKDVCGFAERLERLELGSGLLQRMTEAIQRGRHGLGEVASRALSGCWPD